MAQFVTSPLSSPFPLACYNLENVQLETFLWAKKLACGLKILFLSGDVLERQGDLRSPSFLPEATAQFAFHGHGTQGGKKRI